MQPTGRSTLETASLSRRLLRTPWVGVALALVLAGVVLVAFSVALALATRRIDTAGLELDRTRVTRADARWPDVAPGDRVVAVAGVRGPGGYLWPLLTEAPLWGPPTITVRRGAGEVTIPVRVLPLPPLHAFALAGRVLAGALCVALGALCFLLRPGARVSWLFLAFTTSLAVMLLAMVAASRAPTLLAHMLHASFAFSGSLGLHLLAFEVPTARRGRWARIGIALGYLPAVGLTVIGLTLEPPAAMSHWLWGSLWSLVVGAVLTVVLLHGWLAARRRDRTLASHYRTLLIGMSIGLWLPLLLFLGRTMLGVPYQKWLIHLNAVPVLVYPAMTATAVLRYNALGADRLTAALVNYLLAIGAIAVACVVGLIAVPLAFENNLPASPLVRIAITAAAALAMAPIYRALRRRLDRRFLRAQVDQVESRRTLSELARLVSAGDSAAALAAAHGALQVLHAEHLELWLLASTGEAYHRHEGWGAPGPNREPLLRDGPLAAAIRVDRVWGLGAFTATPMPAAAQSPLGERHLALVAPVRMHGVVSGFVGVGVRRSGLRYDEAEQGFVGTVAAQIGTALERQHGEGSVGAYRVERRLGVGGNAEVHLAWQIGPGGFERRVALKRPLPRVAEDAEHVAMFLHEARIAAALHHPGIAQIIEVGRHQSGYFIAMEYVDGEPLRALLRRGGGPMPLPIVLAIVVPLLDALAYAHAACDLHGHWLRVVHRDITPSNVLVSVAGEVKLVDFGIARSAARVDLTRTGVVRGTPLYMSPEQAHAQELDARSDLYSTAVLLLECLGAAPLDDRISPRAALEVLAAGAPPALVTVVARALEVDPDDRFATASALRDALRAACSPARPASAAELVAWLHATAGIAGRHATVVTVTSDDTRGP